MTPISMPSIPRPYRFKRKYSISTEALLSGLATFVILVLVAAGICAALARRFSV